MKLLVSKNYTGTKHDFVYDCSKQIISNRSSCNIFWKGSRNEHLLQYLKIEQSKLRDEFKSMIDVLKLHDDEINWQLMLGDDFIKNRARAFLNDLNEHQPIFNDYVGKYLPVRLKLFERLTSFIYDNQLQDSLEYVHSQTVTGRAIIRKGLNLMTLKKEKRRNLKSKYLGGAIIEIDVKSLEPRLYLSIVKGVEVEDAYSFLLTDVLNYKIGEIERRQIKLAFISLLYGASTSKIKSITSLSTKDINMIKKFLNVNDFKQKIVNDYNSNGYFENAYGRRITSINAPVNYYIQSTAADYACILYEQLMNNFSSTGIDLIGSIHDAIILDCQKDKIDEVMAVNSLTEKILNITSYFKVVRHS